MSSKLGVEAVLIANTNIRFVAFFVKTDANLACHDHTSQLVVGLGWKHQQAALAGLFHKADVQFMVLMVARFCLQQYISYFIEFDGQKTGKFHLCALCGVCHSGFGGNSTTFFSIFTCGLSYPWLMWLIDRLTGFSAAASASNSTVAL